MPKKNERKTQTLISIAKKFTDEEEAYKYLESILWKNGVVCPQCGSIDRAHYLEPENGERETKTGRKTYRRVWYCYECKKQFSVIVGTIFEDSKIPLSKWLMALHELSSDKNGISSCELARKLDITQKSAWHMAHRIRYAFSRPNADTADITKKLSGTVEADETYFGGLAKNMHKSKREKMISGRGTVGKIPVFSIVAREGEVRSQIMENVNSKNVGEVLGANVESTANLMTDTSTVYPPVGGAFASHEMVDHSADEYVRKLADGKSKAHINTAEGHFSQLKRSIDGTHHHVSAKHLDRYLAEFDYRRNTRKVEDGTRAEDMIQRAMGKRLMYETLIEDTSEP